MGSLSANSTTPLVLLSSTQVQGNFSIPSGSTLSVRAGSTITVSGCVSIGGDLTLDATGVAVNNGSSVDLIFFNETCNSTIKFANVSITGVSQTCATVSAFDQVVSKRLSVIFEVSRIPGCGDVPVVDVAGVNTVAIIAGSVAAGALIIIIILVVVFYKFRHRIIPSMRMAEAMRLRKTASLE